MSTIIVFGSNSEGFHGAGAAGLVMRGESANTWRSDPAFLAAMRSPPGHPARIGHSAIYGVGRGFQTGHHGSSYAIATVTRPGHRRSIPLSEIEAQLADMLAFAIDHPQWSFTILNIGTGYAGYTPSEMESVWARLGPLPPNCVRDSRLLTSLS